MMEPVSYTHLDVYKRQELHMEVTVTKMPQEQIEAENVKVCDLDILKKDDITGLFKAEQPRCV